MNNIGEKQSPLQRTPRINLHRAGQAKASSSHLLLITCKFQIIHKNITFKNLQAQEKTLNAI